MLGGPIHDAIRPRSKQGRINEATNSRSSAFGSQSDDELAKFMRGNLGKWGAEFHYESLFRGLDL